MSIALDFGTVMIIAIGLFLVGVLVAFASIGRRPRKFQPPAPRVELSRLSATQQLQELVEKGGNTRVLIEGSFHIRDEFRAPNGFTVRGGLLLDDDSMVDGPAEVFGNVTLGVRARAARPLFVHGDLILGKDSCVPCCHVDGNAFLHPGSRVDGALHCHALYLVETPLEASASSHAVTLEPAASTSPPATSVA